MKWFSKEEAAKYLGVCISTLDNLESSGLIQGHRIYRGLKKAKPIVRYRQGDLDDLFRKRPRGRPRQDNVAVCDANLKQV